MEAHEIRLGNFYDHYGTIARVTPNTINEVWESQRKWCKPIVLTDEWKLRLGFEDNGFGQCCISINPFEHGVRELVFTGDYLYIRSFDDHPKDQDLNVIWNKDLMKEFYVHELQNLYFSFTRKELVAQNEKTNN